MTLAQSDWGLPQWLDYLTSLHPQTIDLGLSRITQVAQTLNLTQTNLPVFTVAGTNGKGSCVALLESMLRAAGYSTGTYTSPHLWRFNERIRINGCEVDDDTLCEHLAIIEKARGEISLTFFEFTTLAALSIFKHAPLDVLVLEVGLGGRLDAVNMLPADCAIVSSVSIDHEEYLGNSREQIALEKAGIFRPTKPAIWGDTDLPHTVADYASKHEIPLHCQNDAFQYQVEGESWHWQGMSKQYTALPKPAPNILLQNAASVIASLSSQTLLAVPEEAIRKGLQRCMLPGRYQVKAGSVTEIYDVAHNPAATALLAERLHIEKHTGRTHAVLGMLKDKNITASLAPLVEMMDDWYLGSLPGPRGASAAALQQGLVAADKSSQATLFDNITAAYKAAMQAAQTGDRVVIFGSFHTVGEVLSPGQQRHNHEARCDGATI